MPFLCGHFIRRNCWERDAGSRKHAEGFFFTDFYELPFVWRIIERALGNGAGLLLYPPELCASGGGRRSFYNSSCIDTDLRVDDADGIILWRGFRAAPKEKYIGGIRK